MDDLKQLYAYWMDHVSAEDRTALAELEDDGDELQDAFYRDLSFGTAGLRGIIGLGPNRMNVYSVGKATQGFADYLNATFDEPSVVLARDSRNKGDVFVKAAASVLAANGIHAYVFASIEPTPTLSFAVRDLGCSGGINVTASHNPAAYNGYKAYGPDGCQIASSAAKAIQEAIDGIDPFEDVKTMDFDQALAEGLVSWVGDEVVERFLDAVEAQSLESGPTDDALKVVYTPLNGTGLECVTKILSRIGVTDVTVVFEQAQPDGNFPTCPYPNPEARPALELGMRLCEKVRPDLLLATDPDADRVGIAVPHGGDYVLLTGNEVGILMLDYICEKRKERGEDLSDKVAVTTIVSSAMPDAQARHFGFQVRRVLTGFKYIGDQIAKLERVGRSDRFILGYEESYGYMTGTHVRDKDAVNASMTICQMARWHKARGRDLVEAMEMLYERYGYYLNKTISLEYPGSEGARKMVEITSKLRENAPTEVAGRLVARCIDYAQGAALPYVNQRDDEDQVLPAADVIELVLDDGCKVLVRPSGTEPKIKAYLFALAPTREQSQAALGELERAARDMLA